MGKILMHWTYFQMVREELEIARRVDNIELKLQELIEREPHVNNRTALVDLLTYHYQPTHREAVLKAVLLSAFMLETFINSVAKQKLPGFEREALDKLDMPAKWVIIPRLAFGAGPGPDSQLVQSIKELQKQRNFMAHAKPIEIREIREMYDMQRKLPPAKTSRAEKAWQTCLDALTEIQTLAPDFEADNFRIFMSTLERSINLRAAATSFESEIDWSIPVEQTPHIRAIMELREDRR